MADDAAGDYSRSRTQAFEKLSLKQSLPFFVGRELYVLIRSHTLLEQTCVRLHQLLVALFIHARTGQR